MWWGARRDRDELHALSQRVTNLETAQKLLEVEWNEVLDKVTHTLSRLSKRERDANKAAEPQAASESVSVPPKAELWQRAAHLIRGGR